MGSANTRRGMWQNRGVSRQAREHVRVKHHISDTYSGTGRSVARRDRGTKTATTDARHGRSRGRTSRPVKGNISELISGQTVTTKGRLPAIHHGTLLRFRHGAACTQNARFKGVPGGKGNGQGRK